MKTKPGHLKKAAMKIFFVCLIALFMQPINAQNNEWGKGFGSINEDMGRSIKKDAAGNIYIVGSFKGNIADLSLNNSGLADIFIAKYNPSGSLLWAKSIGGLSNEYCYSVDIDSDCKLYLTGSFTSTTVDFDPGTAIHSLSIIGNQDAFIAKYDSSGNYIWAKNFGNTSVGAEGYSIAVNDDFIVITGYFYGGNLIIGSSTLTNAGSNDIFLTKVDKDGNYLLSYSLGNINDDRGRSVSLDNNGNIYFTGIFTSSTIDFNLGAGTYNLTASASDIIIAKYNSSFDFIRAYAMNGTFDEVANCIYISGKNLYLTGGIGSYTVDFDPGPGISYLSSTKEGYYDVFFARYDTALNFSWGKTIGNSSYIEEGKAITTDDNGNVYITGYFAGNTNFYIGGSQNFSSNSNSNDIFFIKYDSLGNYKWAKAIGGSTQDVGNAVIVDQYENAYVTGGFSGTSTCFGYGTDSLKLTSNGDKDIFLAKYTDQATKVTFSNISPNGFTVQCNKGVPTKRAIFLKATDSGTALPQNGTTYTEGQQIGSTGWYCIYNGAASTAPATNLSDGTTYRAMVCEYSGLAGSEIYNTYTAVGNPANQFVPYAEPTTQASNVVISDLRDTSVTISWTNGNGTKRAVFMFQGNSGSASPAVNNTYAANNKFGLGAETSSSGWYCVYNGNGSSVTINGLSQKTSYMINVIEYKGVPGQEKYCSNTGANNPRNFFTIYSTPTLQSKNIVFSSIKYNSLQLSWEPGNGTNYIVFARQAISGEAMPADSTSYTAFSGFEGGSQIGSTGWYCVYKGAQTTAPVSNLAENTTYRFQVFDFNGTTNEEQYLKLTSSDNPANQITEYTPPTISASSIVFSRIGLDSMTISWKNGNGSKRVAFLIKDVSGNLIMPNHTTYVPNSQFGLGDHEGLWYCVYNGTDSFVKVTGLEKGQTYRAFVSEYNGTPGREVYLKNTGSNNPSNKVTKDTQTITFNPLTDKTYGEQDFDPGAISSSGLTIFYSSSNTSVATIVGNKVHIIGAGTCKIYAVQPGNESYISATDSSNFTVLKLNLSIASKVQEKLYGDLNPSLFYVLTPSTLVGSDAISNVTLTTSATQSSDTGSYSITPSNVVFSSGSINNYNISYIDGTLKIRPSAVTITAENKSREYGNNDPAFTYNVAGLKLSDVVGSVNLNTNASITSSVGDYLITPSSATLSSGKISNYTISYSTGTLSITKTSLSIIIENKTRNYGGSDPLFTFKTSGLKNNDSIKSVLFTKLATTASDTGTYAISGSNAEFEDGYGSTNNYSITYIKGTLKITPSQLSITLKGSPVEKYYGDADPAFDFTAEGLLNSDTILSLSYNTSAQTGDTGTFNVTLSNAVFKTGKASNYSITFKSGKLKVKPAALTIKALPSSRTYGELNPEFKWQVTGLKNNDSIRQVTLSCSANPRSATGDYQIVPTNPIFESGKSSNYSIGFNNGLLTVTKSPIEICLVSVDLETGYSMIVWERNNSAGLKGYNIYRQSTQVGEYEKIGNVDITDPGIFLDQTSSIEKHAELYKITTIDKNSVESRLDQCNYHKSLFLQYAGSEGGVNLNWQPYEVENSVINFKSYVIYKGSDSSKLTVVDTVASNIYNYTDNDPLATIYKKYYRIAGIKYDYCYPEGFRKAGSGPFIQSVSNLEDNRLQQPEGIEKLQKNYTFDVIVSPNPVRDISAIRYILPENLNVSARLINALGKTVALIKLGNQIAGNAQFYLDTRKYKIADGIYYLKINAGKYEATTKISVVR